MLLHDDSEMHDRLTVAFKKRFPSQALDKYRRSMKASARHEAQQAVDRDQTRRIVESARADAELIAALERDERHYGPAPERTARMERARRSRTEKLREVALRRNASVESNQPYETLAEFVLDSTGDYDAVDMELKIPKGQSLPDALLSVREEIAQCERDIRNARAAPLPLADATKRIAEDVRRKARGLNVSRTARISPDVIGIRGLASAQGHVEFPSTSVVHDGGGRTEVSAGVELMCWLFGDQIIKKAATELEATYKDKKPLSLAERSRVIAEAESHQLAAERREEKIVSALEDAGHLVYRRPLANPLAVLEIARRA
ncbi:hypothetical protein [Bradyrhizobium sp. MOS003]|uniref:hypothetical protein n=1 Tax=Bradyrhizobium sp. MOS003 TaxID=2133946 RepID=UPI000D13CD63|nr:hypothetical protein [Bradyrhizobium sp. MOS003]PSO19142.1 hypothetical protein C7G42_12635 [Bradyrhizobium sp. MOS003]